MILHHLRRKTDASGTTRAQVLSLYRDILRVIRTLVPAHQVTWYDYTRLKYKEHAAVRDHKQIEKLVKDAKEEIAWVKSVVKRKDQSN